MKKFVQYVMENDPSIAHLRNEGLQNPQLFSLFVEKRNWFKPSTWFSGDKTEPIQGMQPASNTGPVGMQQAPGERQGQLRKSVVGMQPAPDNPNQDVVGMQRQADPLSLKQAPGEQKGKLDRSVVGMQPAPENPNQQTVGLNKHLRSLAAEYSGEVEAAITKLTSDRDLRKAFQDSPDVLTNLVKSWNDFKKVANTKFPKKFQ